KRQDPVFRASAAVILDIRQQQVIDLNSVLSDTPLNNQVLESEMLVLTSDDLLDKVVTKLRLDRDPEFNPSLQQASALKQALASQAARLTELKGPVVAALGLGATDTATADNAVEVGLAAAADQAADARAMERARATAAEDAHEQAVSILRRRIHARPMSPAFAIRISVTSYDSTKAALIANAVADQYVLDQLNAKFDAARRATGWLKDRLDELRDRVKSSEAAIQAYNAVNRTGDSQAVQITHQQIATINGQLVAARAEATQARAELEQARRLINGQGYVRSATSLSSPLTVSLRGQRADIAREQAEFSERYGPKHPTMIELSRKLRDVDGAIASEVRQIVTGLERDLRVAQSRVDVLSSELANLEGEAEAQSRAGVGLSQLEREAEANREIYNNFLQRLNQTREQEGFQTADSRVIAFAEPPGAPFAPKAKMTAVLGGFAGGFAGVAIVALLQLLVNTYRTANSITERTGLRVLAGMPRLSRRRRRRILSYLERRPNSEYAEAARALRNSTLTALAVNQHRSLLVTSALPDEGKSLTSIVLAHMMALGGKRVIVVDCDLRRPSIAGALGLKVGEDLVDVLEGEALLADAIVEEPETGLRVLPLRRSHGPKADLLASPEFGDVVYRLSAVFDVVIIDSGPVLGVSDFTLIGQYVDAALVVVEWNRTPTGAFERALEWLYQHDINVLGAVMTKVDRKREARHEPAGYGTSYTYLKGYYAN
ncbi:MAG: GNVR domain-containing protein, partial [Pseudomonadota bacterium]